MVVYVADANIWIDLHHADLLDAAFQLDVSWVTPDLITHELRTLSSDLLVTRGLTIRTLNADELMRIPALSRTYPGPSAPDLAALVVANADGGIVITGDGPLRKAAEQEDLPVHGVLWILDQLVEREIIAYARARAALRAMLSRGARLPEQPVRERLDQWSTP